MIKEEAFSCSQAETAGIILWHSLCGCFLYLVTNCRLKLTSSCVAAQFVFSCQLLVGLRSCNTFSTHATAISKSRSRPFYQGLSTRVGANVSAHTHHSSATDSPHCRWAQSVSCENNTDLQSLHILLTAAFIASDYHQHAAQSLSTVTTGLLNMWLDRADSLKHWTAPTCVTNSDPGG